MTTPMRDLDPAALAQLETRLAGEYQLLASNKMSLDLSRGKPAPDQLDLSNGLDGVLQGDYSAADGTDARNYGGMLGLPEARQLGAELLGVPTENVLAAGNSSLNLMHLVVSTALDHGLWGDTRNWRQSDTPTVLTPVPGYDRHFTLSASLGVDMHNIDMTETGPDMAQAGAAVADNPSIKGIWCVPKYANPTGCIYSDETVQAIAELPNVAAADDFVVLWDNAYAVHDLDVPGKTLASLHSAAERSGTENHIVQFASTSKITFAGAGLAFLAASEAVLSCLVKHLSLMTIGFDKVNQLRHARFLNGRLAEHMQGHARLLKPKFEVVQQRLEQDLGEWDIAEWTTPEGGYFVSLDLQDGLARQVIDLAREVGLTLTPAGATFPHGQDPRDRNVRIAPTYADLEDLRAAMHVLTLCVKLATARKLLSERTHG